jgi:hypothetical protein
MPDEYLLFTDLPFNFEVDLPLDFGNGVFLVDPGPAYQVIDADDELAALATPERVARMGQVDACLRSAHGRGGSERARENLWLAVLALRLARPVHIGTSSSFGVEAGQWAGMGISLSKMETSVNPQAAASFDADVVRQARDINRRLQTMRKPALARFRSAMTMYSHVDLGRVASWQLSVLGLFACLDCLFPQPSPRVANYLVREKYGERLARRVAKFLSTIARPPRLQSWIATSYGRWRNPLAHGFHDVGLGSRGSASRSAMLLKLHEVTRLTLLGFMGLSNDDILGLLPAHADTVAVQNGLDAIGAAPASYLQDQQFWR